MKQKTEVTMEALVAARDAATRILDEALATHDDAPTAETEAAISKAEKAVEKANLAIRAREAGDARRARETAEQRRKTLTERFETMKSIVVGLDAALAPDAQWFAETLKEAYRRHIKMHNVTESASNAYRSMVALARELELDASLLPPEPYRNVVQHTVWAAEAAAVELSPVRGFGTPGLFSPDATYPRSDARAAAE